MEWKSKIEKDKQTDSERAIDSFVNRYIYLIGLIVLTILYHWATEANCCDGGIRYSSSFLRFLDLDRTIQRTL